MKAIDNLQDKTAIMAGKGITDPAAIEAFFDGLLQEIPEPRIELKYINPYTLIVGVILSAQSTDAGVNRVTDKLFQSIQTPEQMVALGEENLRTVIQPLGFFRMKAKHIIAMSQRLIDHYNSTVPSDRIALESLPGVGRKSANVILNVIFNQSTLAVDTHVFRVSNRTGFAPGNTPAKVEENWIPKIPPKWGPIASHLLVLHGRYICKARKPLCHRCKVYTLCQYPHKSD